MRGIAATAGTWSDMLKNTAIDIFSLMEFARAMCKTG